MRKVLYILIGPKGAGKTYIGSKVNQKTTIRFLGELLGNASLQ